MLSLDERSFAVVERAIGRPLREAERAVDVLKLDAALNEAKDELDAAISDEMLRATRAWVRRGKHGFPLLDLTKAMRRPLERLHALGREEAFSELERLGYVGLRRPERRFAAPDPLPGAGMEGIENTMRQGLLGVSLRIEDELVSLDLGGAGSQAIAEALLAVPGARDLASRVVSTALTSGLALTFEENAELVPCWQYSSVLDGGTCDRCRPLDGKEYHSLGELFVDLPNFGPNPRCRGGGRCRCRAVPCPPDEATLAAQENARLEAEYAAHRFTDAQREAVSSYSGAGYADINRVLRDPDLDPLDLDEGLTGGLSIEELEQQIALLDASMRPLAQPTRVMRGVDGRAFPTGRPVIGEPIGEAGFMSTTVNPANPLLQREYLIEIELPAGTEAVYVTGVTPIVPYPEEWELLLARDFRWRVAEIIEETDPVTGRRRTRVRGEVVQ